MSIETILVSGPLGSGKTTIIKNHLIPYYKKKGVKNELSLLVNDAAIGNNKGNILNTDGRRLLGDFENENILMFGQTCVCCDGIETFKSALEEKIDQSKTKFLIIEPTGIANPNNIADAIIDKKNINKFNLKNIAYLLPVKNFNIAESHSGIKAANHVILTWLPEQENYFEIKKVAEYALESNPDANIHFYDEDFSWDIISNLNEWNIESYLSRKGFFQRKFVPIPISIGSIQKDSGNSMQTQNHEKYETKSYEINPYSIEEDPKILEKTLEKLAKSGIERAKGYIRLDGDSILPFDIVRGRYIIGESERDQRRVYGNGSLEIISKNIPKNIDETIKDLTEGAGDAVAIKGTSLEEKLELLKHYDNLIETSIPENGFISQTYEGADIAFTLAEQIKREHNYSNSIRDIFPRYMEIHKQAITSLKESNQENKNYIQSMFGLKVLYAWDTYKENLPKSIIPDIKYIAREFITAKSKLGDIEYGFIQKGSNPQDYIDYLQKMEKVATNILGDSK